MNDSSYFDMLKEYSKQHNKKKVKETTSEVLLERDFKSYSIDSSHINKVSTFSSKLSSKLNYKFMEKDSRDGLFEQFLHRLVIPNFIKFGYFKPMIFAFNDKDESMNKYIDPDKESLFFDGKDLRKIGFKVEEFWLLLMMADSDDNNTFVMSGKMKSRPKDYQHYSANLVVKKGMFGGIKKIEVEGNKIYYDDNIDLIDPLIDGFTKGYGF